MLCDMHTHSEHSHDSGCKIENMLLAQIEKGTAIFAVTDHFDCYSHNDYDIFTPIKRSYDTVKALNEKYKDKCLVLSGIEISEGFWFPEVYEKGISMLDYDVVIGSMHCPRFEGVIHLCANTDFSQFSVERVKQFLEACFDDNLRLLAHTDCDILGHLTYPLRYIVGKYGFDIDITEYYDKIDKILKTVIEKGIALEVNTSSYDFLNDFVPTAEIVRRYYDFGGRMITLGSDAHGCPNASFHFDDAVKMLKEIGFDCIYYFKKRKPIAISI